MRFNIISRKDPLSEKIKEELTGKLTRHAWQLNIDRPTLVISVGGDGTMLEAFHRYKHQLSRVAFVGVHTGRLGFYADWRPAELDTLVRFIVEEQREDQYVSYPLVEVTLIDPQGKEERFLALNECTVKATAVPLVMTVVINGDPFETFRGDGLCISTPSGSTAYNKSLGGAIIHPSLPSIQITEMASINNRVYRTIGSPLILPAHHICQLVPQSEAPYQVSVDHLTLPKKEVKSIWLKVAKEKVRFARYRPFPFWKRVRESFIDD